ncbi:MAG: ABC transporter ATP-binding protein [Thermoproteota archaeon]
MPDIELRNVTKIFKKKKILNKINLTINDKTCLTILGPPGSGKTMILRLIAGLEKPDEGEILINGNEVNEVPPDRRGVSMMFQNLALYPHMTVYQNLSFSLEKLGLSADEIQNRIYEVTEMLRIKNLLDRRPRQLSGGERQRVALARALIRKTPIVLLDDPLGHLDAKLRVYSRLEIRKFQRAFGQTMVISTPDTQDALSMGDRVAVLHDGKIVQVDTPENLLERPKTIDVATMIGTPKINLIGCTLKNENDNLLLDAGKFKLKTNLAVARFIRFLGQKVIVGVRPSDIDIVAEPSGIEGSADIIGLMGKTHIIKINIDGVELTAAKPLLDTYLMGKKKIWIDIKYDKLIIFDKDGRNIMHYS